MFQYFNPVYQSLYTCSCVLILNIFTWPSSLKSVILPVCRVELFAQSLVRWTTPRLHDTLECSIILQNTAAAHAGVHRHGPVHEQEGSVV